MMQHKIFITIAACLAGLLLSMSVAKAEQQLSASELEPILVEMVNTARVDPVSVAKALGLDQEQLFPGIAEDSPFWDKQKWWLRKDPGLYTAVTDHAQDMLDRDYFGHVSPEGLGPEDRARQAGYSPVFVKEYMSVFAFQNYIPAEQAALELFKSFFQDQVQDFKQGQASIFDHDSRDIGLCFQSGKLTLEGKKQNVYLFVLQYGAAQDVYLEESLMRLLNTARNDPGQALADYDIDQQEAIQVLGENSWVLDSTLPPVMFYSTTTDWRWQQRSSSKGNNDSKLTLAWEAEIPEQASAWEAALILFAKVFSLEDEQGFSTILDPWARSAVLSTRPSSADPQMVEAEMVVALSETGQQPYMLMGNVYDSQPDQKGFQPESGLEGFRIVLKDSSGEIISTTATSYMGAYRLARKNWYNSLEVWSDQALLLSYTFWALDSSTWLDIDISELE